MNLNEQRFLIKAQVMYDEDGDGVYEVMPLSAGGTKLAFKATDEQMLRFLRRIKAKDNMTEPRSLKGVTYDNILTNIKTGTDSFVHVWSTHYPDQNGINEILQENVTKNTCYKHI